MTTSWDELELDLKEVVSATVLAEELQVQPNGLPRMAKERTIPLPTAMTRTKRGSLSPLWFAEGLDKYFATLHDDIAGYAPVKDALGIRELEEYGVYVCPQTSRHIWNRRCSRLVLIRSDQERDNNGMLKAEIYEVEYIQTTHGVRGEKFADKTGHTPQKEQISWAPFMENHGSKRLTLFKLNLDSMCSLPLAQGAQRGGTISSETLNRALGSERGAERFQGGIVHVAE